jgi:hypothetical protein
VPRIHDSTTTFQSYNNYYPTATTSGKSANLTPGKKIPTLDATAASDFSTTLNRTDGAMTGTSNQITPVNNSAGNAWQTYFSTNYENITRAKAELRASGTVSATEQAGD